MALMGFREKNQVRWRGVRPAHNGTQVIAQSQATNATVNVYTVPAGSVLYLCEASVFVMGGAQNSYLYVQTSGAVYVRRLAIGLYAGATYFIFGDHNHFWPPYEIPENYVITLTVAGVGATAEGSIFGWVE